MGWNTRLRCVRSAGAAILVTRVLLVLTLVQDTVTG